MFPLRGSRGYGKGSMEAVKYESKSDLGFVFFLLTLCYPIIYMILLFSCYNSIKYNFGSM